MIKITLKDGKVMEFDAPVSVLDVAASISQGLLRNAMCATVNGRIADLRDIIKSDATLNINTFDSEEGKKAFWHTSSHVLAQAVKRLFPQAKLAIGPSTASGFYYDFDCDVSFNSEILLKIEEEMKKIIKESPKIEKFELSREKALELMANNPYKVELIEDLDQDEILMFYKQGEFVDLCAGPHIMDVSKIKAVKLLSTTGAYWKGSEKNKMLQRIYGVSFPKASELAAHLEALQQAKLRDHNKVGRELGYFTTSEIIGQGLPLLMPKGAKLFQILTRFVEDEEQRRGYLLTKTPLMAKSDLYKVSGHWDHYKEGMFVLGDEEKDDEVFALRPMTCPFQYTIYNAGLHSYRDLPIRYSETSTLFRNEASGEMHGLIRVRQFTISEGHIILTPDQLSDEFKKTVDLIVYVMKSVGLYEDLFFRFSKRDPMDKQKYIGDDEGWNDAEAKMKEILDSMGLVYKTAVGEAAFYGPKLDIQIKNVHGKEDTLITIQIDPFLAQRFDMVYIDKDGQKKRPYIIHRTSIGCYERTMALILEKYMGALPLWMSPEQVRILPISQKFEDYCFDLKQKLEDINIRAFIDLRNEKIGYKIREAQIEKIPYMLVIGEKEQLKNQVSVRSRGKGDIGTMSVEDFLIKVDGENKAKVLD